MKSKQQTPLGFLMRLLDVSLSDLGDYLYVAQTTISKWKTGARALRPGSQHFAGIVEYFQMLTRDPERREKMEQLFARLYPEQPLETPEDIGACVRIFLGGKQLPPTSVRQALTEEGRLYTAEIGIYTGETGCRTAFSQLTAAIMAQPAMPMSAVARGDFGRLPGLLPPLDRGCKLRLLMDPLPPGALLSPLAAVLVHPGVETRLLADGAPMSPYRSLTIAGRELMLLSSMAPGQSPYCALYTDAVSVQQNQIDFDMLWQDATRVFETIPNERLGPELYRQAAESTLDTPLDWLAPSLPYLTMSDELLMEIMQQNGVSGRAWTHVLHGREALLGQAMRLFIPAPALRAPQETLPELSMLCGRPITMTPGQAKRHMLDTAALLRGDFQLSIVPLQAEDSWVAMAAFVKRNAFAGYLDTANAAVLATRRPALVEAFMAAMDGLAAQVTVEGQSPGYVAGILEQAALGVADRA